MQALPCSPAAAALRTGIRSATGSVATRSLTTCTALLAAALLAGCAAPYKPHAEGEAAKLRLRLEPGPLFATLASNVRPISGGRCGAPTALPMVRPHVEPPTDPRGPQATQPPAPPTYARAGMYGSTDPLRSDNVELLLPPGRQMFMLALVAGTSQCRVEVALDLEPRRQYQLHYVFDTGSRRCRAYATRLDETTAPPRWVAQPYSPELTCPAS